MIISVYLIRLSLIVEGIGITAVERKNIGCLMTLVKKFSFYVLKRKKKH